MSGGGASSSPSLYLGLLYVQVSATGLKVMLAKNGPLSMIPMVKFAGSHAVTAKDLAMLKDVDGLRDKAGGGSKVGLKHHSPLANNRTAARISPLPVSPGNFRAARPAPVVTAGPAAAALTLLSDSFIAFQRDFSAAVDDLVRLLGPGSRSDLSPDTLWCGEVIAISPEMNLIAFGCTNMTRSFPSNYSPAQMEFVNYAAFEIIHGARFAASRTTQQQVDGSWTRKVIAATKEKKIAHKQQVLAAAAGGGDVPGMISPVSPGGFKHTLLAPTADSGHNDSSLQIAATPALENSIGMASLLPANLEDDLEFELSPAAALDPPWVLSARSPRQFAPVAGGAVTVRISEMVPEHAANASTSPMRAAPRYLVEAPQQQCPTPAGEFVDVDDLQGRSLAPLDQVQLPEAAPQLSSHLVQQQHSSSSMARVQNHSELLGQAASTAAATITPVAQAAAAECPSPLTDHGGSGGSGALGALGHGIGPSGLRIVDRLHASFDTLSTPQSPPQSPPATPLEQ